MKKLFVLTICLFLALLNLPARAAEVDAQAEKEKQLELLNNAKEKEEAGSFASAAKYYRKLAKRQTEHAKKAEYFLKEADCLFAAKKTHRATLAYRELMKEYALYVPFGRVVENLRTLAENYADGNGTLFGVRDRSEAIDTYFFILTEAPSITVSLADRKRLAELLVKENRREEAITVYQEILKLDPTLDDIRMDMALLLLDLCKRGDGDGAIRRAATRQAKFILDRNPEFGRREEAELILAATTEEEAERLLELGKFYLRPVHLNPAASRKYLLELVQSFPGTKAAWEAKNMLDTDLRLAEPKAEGDGK